MKKTINIKGMNCEGCARTIENVVKLQGNTIRVNYKKKLGSCDISNEKELQSIIEEINKSGFHAAPA